VLGGSAIPRQPVAGTMQASFPQPFAIISEIFELLSEQHIRYQADQNRYFIHIWWPLLHARIFAIPCGIVKSSFLPECKRLALPYHAPAHRWIGGMVDYFLFLLIKMINTSR